MQRFYTVATAVLFDHEALLDKFVGDEVVGFFLPFMAGDGHARVAVETARALFDAAGYGSPDGPWIHSARACTRGPRSWATSRAARRASSPRWATRSTWRRISPPRQHGRDPDHRCGGGVARDRRSRAAPPLAEGSRAGCARDQTRGTRAGRGRCGVTRGLPTSPRTSRTPRSSPHPAAPDSLAPWRWRRRASRPR